MVSAGHDAASGTGDRATDGIWSAVRHYLFPEVQPQFSGLIAWRGTLDATQLPREYTSARCRLDGAERASGGLSDLGRARVNVVAVVPGTWNRPGWSAPAISEIKNASQHRPAGAGAG